MSLFSNESQGRMRSSMGDRRPSKVEPVPVDRNRAGADCCYNRSQTLLDSDSRSIQTSNNANNLSNLKTWASATALSVEEVKGAWEELARRGLVSIKRHKVVLSSLDH